MSVIFVEGFEEFGTSGSQSGMNRKFSSVSFPTITMGTGRVVGQSIVCAAGSQEFRRTALPSSAAYTIGIAYKRLSTGTHTITFADAGGSRQITIRTQSSQRIDLCTGLSTQVAVSANDVLPVDGSFHYITAFIDSANSVARIEVDGVQVISYAGSLGSAIDAVGLASSSGTGCEFDDWFVSDNELHEECIVLTQFPTGDGDTTDFTPDTGTDNYARVDDNPSDEDTSYVEGSSDGNLDLYTFDAITQTDVLAVQVNLVCKTPSSTDNVEPSIKSGGTVYNGASESIGTTYETAIAVFNDDPDTSSAWIYSDLNNAQFGGEIA